MQGGGEYVEQRYEYDSDGRLSRISYFWGGSDTGIFVRISTDEAGRTIRGDRYNGGKLESFYTVSYVAEPGVAEVELGREPSVAVAPPEPEPPKATTTAPSATTTPSSPSTTPITSSRTSSRAGLFVENPWTFVVAILLLGGVTAALAYIALN
jgi:hypothetical protein